MCLTSYELGLLTHLTMAILASTEVEVHATCSKEKYITVPGSRYPPWPLSGQLPPQDLGASCLPSASLLQSPAHRTRRHTLTSAAKFLQFSTRQYLYRGLDNLLLLPYFILLIIVISQRAHPEGVNGCPAHLLHALNVRLQLVLKLWWQLTQSKGFQYLLTPAIPYL